MNRSVFSFPSPAQPMQFDGERYTSGVEGPIQREHYHRYLFALRYCVDKKVLDVASGEGYGSFLLGQAARSVIGIEIDQKAVDFANKNYKSERVSYRRGDAAKLPIADQSVDVVVSFETIEHFADQTDFIMEIDRVLRPDGLVIMSSPNREIYSEAKNYQNPFHVNELNKQEFVDLLSLRFPHLHLLEQGAVLGSLIVPLLGEKTGNVEGFTTSDGQLFERLIGVPGAPYFVALAARAPIPPPPQSVLHADFFHEQIERQFAAIEQVRQQEAMAHLQHARHMADVEASLQAELAAQRDKIAGGARREHELAGQLEQMQAAIGVLHARLASQEQDAAKHHEVEVSLQAELAAQREKIAVGARREDEMVRRLASTRTLYDAELPPKLRFGRFIHKQTRRLARDYRAVASSPLFDREWYLENNPDVAAAHCDPVLHYLRHGAAEGRQSGPFFDSRRYIVSPDVAEAQMNPLLHFVRCCAREERPLGQQTPPLRGSLSLGWAPSESFDPQFYLMRYPDIKAANISPLMHFQTLGKIEGRRGLPSAQRLTFAPLKDPRQPILVICHEASRTGAPILGWNLIRDLRKKAPVITLLMSGGVLEEDFAAESDVVVGPLTHEEWHPAEAAFIAERLVRTYRPLYAVANSIETSAVVQPLGALGVPSVALVHEFASYTRPLGRMLPTFDWAMHIVFPAQIVADSSFESFPALEQRRGIHVLAQGRQLLPDPNSKTIKEESDIGEVMRSADEKDTFIVLGAGHVHMRKGVDLFLSVATAARRLAPDVRFKFIWIGDGYKPDEDVSYSVYLREQINKSDLQDIVVFLESVADFEPAYRTADVFLMSSRLDPQPNVGIDAMALGLPIICFAGACGTGEVLASDPETRSLVVPHLDAEAAANEICRVAKDPELREAMSCAVERVGRRAFNGEIYATQIDAWGREAAAALSQTDLETLRASGAVERELALPPQASLPRSASVEQIVLMQSTVVGLSRDQHRNAYFRRAIPGFHPQAYAAAHIVDCAPGGQNPTAHWLRHGRPQGQWSHPVFSPKNRPQGPHKEVRVALHAHFHYPDLAPELAKRLTANRTTCDLFVSTDTEAKVEALRRAFAENRGVVTVRLMPNLGRNIGPLLTGFSEDIAFGEYDLWGHVHGKKSAWSDAGIGDAYRTFLWDNLIGGEYPMLDIAVAAFASDPKLGLIFTEEPHLVGWDDNRENTEMLAERMGLSRELPEFFDFPLGMMFWFRPPALRRLFALGLNWEDYPKEPLPYDGSLLHAIERIVPFVAASDSYGLAGLRAPRSNW